MTQNNRISLAARIAANKARAAQQNGSNGQNSNPPAAARVIEVDGPNGAETVIFGSERHVALLLWQQQNAAHDKLTAATAPAPVSKAPAPAPQQGKTQVKAPVKAQRSFKKTECPISRDEFLANAKELDLSEAGLVLKPREFSSGSFGWFGNVVLKVIIEVDGEPVEVKVPISINAAIANSKEAPRE